MEVRRRYGRKTIQIVLFTEIPDSDYDYRFQKKRDNDGRNSNKKGIAAPPEPILKKKPRRKRIKWTGRIGRRVQMEMAEVAAEKMCHQYSSEMEKDMVKAEKMQGC